MSLYQLPYELWPLIFDHLDNTDLSSLCSIDELSGALKRMVCVVQDNADESPPMGFSNATHFTLKDVLASIEKVTKFPIVVLIVHSSERQCRTSQYFPRLYAEIPTLRIVFAETFGRYPYYGSNIFKRLPVESQCFNHVTFCSDTKTSSFNLTNLVFLCPEKIAFGFVKSLQLTGCRASVTGRKLIIPHLEELSIDGDIMETIQMLDFEHGLPILKKLILTSSPSDPGVILKDLKSASLESFTISKCYTSYDNHNIYRIEGLKNIHFPNCSNVDLQGTDRISSIDNVCFGKVTALCINQEVKRWIPDWRRAEMEERGRPLVNISITGLICPSLQSLTIYTGDSFTFTSSEQTKPTSLALEFSSGNPTKNISVIDRSLFQRVRQLNVKNGVHLIKCAPLVETLTIDGEAELLGRAPPGLVGEMLQDLILEDPNMLQSDTGSFEEACRTVKRLSVNGITRSAADLVKVASSFPCLDELEFSAIDWGKITGIHCHSITRLKLGLKYDEKSKHVFQILNCSFNSLKHLSIQFVPLNDNESKRPEPAVLKAHSVFIFSAPNLETLYVGGWGIVMDELELDGFRKLKVLQLHCHLNHLNFEKCGRELETLEFSPQAVPLGQANLFKNPGPQMEVYSTIMLGKLTKMTGTNFPFSEDLYSLEVPLLNKWRIPALGQYNWSWESGSG